MKRVFKKEHSMHQKLERIFNLMDELNIKIEIPYENAIGFPFLSSEDSKFVKRVSIVDAETGIGVSEFPPTFEFKLIWDDAEPDKYKVDEQAYRKTE